MSEFDLSPSLFVPFVACLIAPGNLACVCVCVWELLLSSRDDISFDICCLIKIKIDSVLRFSRP